jgi:hypothetical protein
LRGEIRDGQRRGLYWVIVVKGIRKIERNMFGKWARGRKGKFFLDEMKEIRMYSEKKGNSGWETWA